MIELFNSNSNKSKLYNVELLKEMSDRINEIIPLHNEKTRNFLLSYLEKNTNKLNLTDIEKTFTIFIEKVKFELNNNFNEKILKSENELKSKINSLEKINNTMLANQDKIGSDLTTYLDSYKISKKKGGFSENKLYNILSEIFPDSSISDVSKKGHQTDFLINFTDNEPIMIENKNNKEPIDKPQYIRFIDNITKNDCSGILVSHSSIINGTKDMQIDFNKSKVVIYVHNCHYDRTKLKLAINTVNSISKILKKYNNKEQIYFSKDILEKINIAYTEHISNITSTITHIKNAHKKTLEKLSDCKNIPVIEYILQDYSSEIKRQISFKKNLFVCKHCKIYNGKCKKSIVKHEQQCKMNPKNTIKQQPSIKLIESDSDTYSDTDSDTENDNKIKVKQEDITNKPTKSTNKQDISDAFINSLINKRIQKKKYKGVIYYFIDNHLHKINEDNSVGDKYAKFNGKKIELL